MAANWLTFEPVSAPNPKKGEPPLTLMISPELVDLNSEVRKETPIFQLWCHVVGELPPINNISQVERSATPPTLTTLNDATACFGGISRPHDDEENGESVLVYVLNPKVSIEHYASMVCMAQPVIMPKNCVMTVLVRPYHPLQNGNLDVNGIVTRIEPVLCSPDEPDLPARHATRYAERFW